MKNQKTKVLEYIKTNGSISSYEAYARLGITQRKKYVKYKLVNRQVCVDGED